MLVATYRMVGAYHMVDRLYQMVDKRWPSRSWPAGGSSSPAPPASWARRSPNGSCALPRAQVVVLVRPGRRATADQRAAREILRNDCFDRLREELGERFGEGVGHGWAVPGDVGRDGLGLDDEGRRLLAAATSWSTRRPPSVSTPPSTRRSRSTCWALPGGGGGARPGRPRDRPVPSHRGVHRLRRRHPPG